MHKKEKSAFMIHEQKQALMSLVTSNSVDKSGNYVLIGKKKATL